MRDVHSFDVLTFDCYGTLIDWERGLWAALRPTLAAHDVVRSAEETLELFGELESAIEAGPYVPYRYVLRKALEGMGDRWGFTPSERELDDFAASLAEWPAFPDVPEALSALGARHRIGVISNIDDDLFAHSARHIGARIDWVVTAQQVGAYKPSPENFLRGIERACVPRSRILHVAQSKYHDIAPAKALGLAAVWVNRRHDRRGSGATPQANAEPDLEVRSLAELAERMGGS
jgi:2-haloacid dehalogenase